mgnify:CR=1 FL=1
MFDIKSKIQESPYLKFYAFYDEALTKNQSNPEAMVISSYDGSSSDITPSDFKPT